MVLTDKDIETYNFIKDYMLKTGFVPSVREIGEGIKLRSTSSVFTHVNYHAPKGTWLVIKTTT